MAEANFIDLFLARCWHWDKQLKSHTATPESAALALNEAILIAESRNTKPLKGNAMSILDRIEKIDLENLWKIRYAENGCIADVVQELLNGQDKMLVPLEELNSLNLDLAGAGLQAAVASRALSSQFVDSIQSYLSGIIDARTSLLAAGVEPIPA